MEQKKIDLKKYEYSVVLDSHTPISEEAFAAAVPSPAKTYPFPLDVFQKQAIMTIERGENVFVAAHTSAGKTVVAEYAIATAFSRNTRVIYTSPIKALSNQKFRDLKEEFKDVGIITGDIQLNPEAPCLIMTTEILLQMLYANSETINDLEFVIFDECHYVNDSKRGHVWEEVFILLPGFVKLVLLSATVPNVIQFSDWLGRTRQRKTYVVSTTKRPVPLKHYFYLGRDGKTQSQQVLILEGEGQLLKANYDEAAEVMKERKAKFGFIRVTPAAERNVYLNLIRHLQKTDKLPVICFTLSRRKCDQNLDILLGIKEENLYLTSKSESFYIRRFVRRHLKHLAAADLKLEQVMKVSAMLERGFGVHHSGVLPLLKELTEILFSSGLVKVLFATETFAMGVNMPARTVVFDSLNKHDGTCRRSLKPSEYIQMAGRAGRRGKDPDGTVIILAKYDLPSFIDCQQVMKGSAQTLESQFRLTYHMILNMLKSQSSSIEHFLSSSYREHSKVLLSSGATGKIAQLETAVGALPALACDHCSADIAVWGAAWAAFTAHRRPLMGTLLIRASDKKLLNSGRAIVYSEGQEAAEEQQQQQLLAVGMLLKVVKGVGASISGLVLLTEKGEGKARSYEVKEISSAQVVAVLGKQVKAKMDIGEVISENEQSARGRKAAASKYATEEAGAKFDALGLPPSGVPLLLATVESFTGAEKLGPKLDPDFSFAVAEYGRQLRELGQAKLECLRCPAFLEHYRLYAQRAALEEAVASVRYKVSSESLELLPEYKQRVEVLQRLGFLDEHLVLLPKGQIASCIADNELLITEIVFENLLGGLSDEAIPAILSCFIFDAKGFREPSTEHFADIPELVEITEKIMSIGVFFGEIEYEHGVEQSTTHFIETLNFESIRAVYEWAKGESFLEMMKHTELQEGIMVRCIQRVDELLKNIRLAAKNLESKEFEEKLERASRLIRRDIVFAPSLYTVQDGVVGVFEEEEESRPQTVEEEEEEKEKEGVTEGKRKKKNADDNSVEGDKGEEKFDEEDEDDDDEDDDALFTYDFGAVKEDEELEGNGGKFQEEEQFNSNFL